MTDLSAELNGEKFGAILVDPPWRFLTYSKKKSVPTCGADPYETMSYDDLKAMDVKSVAAPKCALFMWVIGSHLDQAIALGKHWGFKYKTDAFYWCKNGSFDERGQWVANPNIMGMGKWTRKQVEPCLLFTMGSPPRISGSVRQAILSPRREHSRKPDAAYERIEALVAGPYLEMFATQRVPGWTGWGKNLGKYKFEGERREAIS